ncbi:MAG: dihydrofolate reductase [Oscillospiraceae bacterium]|nr:dihydrofolate reductase [Oscillospiraceae bacterium]
MNLIVAADQNWTIGKGGDQLAYIKEDLKRFQALTLGKAVILGRKTLATFPGGKPLKGRVNLILSQNPEFQAEGAQVFPNLEALLAQAPEDAFVVGGASVYQQLLDRCQTAYVTQIHSAFPADSWFPNLDRHPGWELVEEQGPFTDTGGLRFSYRTYRAKY